MKKFVTAFLTVVLLAGPAWAYYSVNIEGNALPTTFAGWSKSGSDMSLVTEEGRTCLYQAASVGGTSVYYMPTSGLDHSQDITIEISMKIGQNGTETGLGAGYLWFANGTYLWGLHVAKPDDGTYGNNNNGFTWGAPGYAQLFQYDNRQAQTYWDYDDADDSADTIQPGFHTFRWEISAADPTVYAFSVDGISGPALWHRTSGQKPLQTSLVDTDTRVIVGDWSGSKSMEIWYDYIRITNVPEPVALGVLVIGGLAGLARRRK